MKILRVDNLKDISALRRRGVPEKQYKDKLKKRWCNFDDTMNFTAYEGKDTNPKEVIDLSETLPFCRPESDPD